MQKNEIVQHLLTVRRNTNFLPFPLSPKAHQSRDTIGHDLGWEVGNRGGSFFKQTACKDFCTTLKCAIEMFEITLKELDVREGLSSTFPSCCVQATLAV